MGGVKKPMSKYPFVVPFVVTIFTVLHWHRCSAQSYNNTKAIFDDKLSSAVYHTEVRPLDDQSKPVNVSVYFQLVAIVQVDDVGQRFLCNGFLAMSWEDKRLSWDLDQYGNQHIVRPLAKNIWKPRVLLLNTITKRDIFEDSHAPVTVLSNGLVQWIPGSLFQTSCELDMTNYPFDKQTCVVQLLSMGHEISEVDFVGTNQEVGRKFFTPNGEWDLVTSNVTAGNFDVSNKQISGIEITFTMKRRPTFLLLNIVMPVVLLSFLNILVFAIPVESGEKIGYGITVLLALSVFLSIVSGLLPRSSQLVPNVTIYLFILLIVSTLTVVDSIIIVYLNNLEENEDKSIKAKNNYKQAMTKIQNVTGVVRPVSAIMRTKLFQVGPTGSSGKFQRSSFSDTDSLSPYDDAGAETNNRASERDLVESCKNEPRKNKYRVIGKYIDIVSFVVFFVVWLGLTMGFLINISTD